MAKQKEQKNENEETPQTDTQLVQNLNTSPVQDSVSSTTTTTTVTTIVSKKEYRVLSFDSALKLENACSNALNDGWVLVGGLCVSHVITPLNVVTIYSQAIIKNK